MPRPSNSTPVLISCPDCSGVLSVRHVNNSTRSEYECQTGHRYSTLSLLQSKEEQFEHVLWHLVALAEHLETISEDAEREAKEDGDADLVGELRRRRGQIRDHRERTRQMLSETEPAKQTSA
jgi:hypothetical protein